MKFSGHVRFEVSPVFDLLASMFRLHSHERLDRVDETTVTNTQLDYWVNHTRKLLPDSVKDELGIFFNIESFLGMSLVRVAYLNNAYHTYEDFIALLEKTTAEDLFRSFLQTGFVPGEITDLKKQEDVLQFIKSSNLPEIEKWKLTYLYFDIENTKRRFVNLVQKCWNLYFEDEVDEVLNKQEESIKQLINQFGLSDRDSLFSIFHNLDRDYAIQKDTVLMSFPSVFYNISSLTSNSDSDNLLLHLYGVNQPEYLQRSVKSKDELMDNFKRIADEKRIKMIQILNIAPAYGYELAQKLDLSNSTVSHHLSTLASMGIVKSTRKDSRVYYEVNKERLRELMLSITDALVQ